MVFPMKGMPAPKGKKPAAPVPFAGKAKKGKAKAAPAKGKGKPMPPASGSMPPQFGGPPK